MEGLGIAASERQDQKGLGAPPSEGRHWGTDNMPSFQRAVRSLYLLLLVGQEVSFWSPLRKTIC